MRKPVRKTEEEIAAIVAKRKPQKVQETKAIPTGNLEKVTEAFEVLAKKAGVPVSEVRVTSYYYGNHYLKAVRNETPEEMLKRIKAEESYKYTQKKAEYDRWVANEQYRIEQGKLAEARLAQSQKTNTKQCCPSNCCCRR